MSKLNSFFLAALFLPLLFTSCLPQISIKAGANDEASIFFTTGFSEKTAKTLKNLTGADASSPLFNKEDILLLLQSAGAINTSAAVPSSTEVSATGVIPEISKNQLAKTGFISKDEKSLCLTIGPKQITAFYALLNDDAKSYLDLLMIPSLIGESMSLPEYQELLASMYGPTFAEEITGGKLSITLSSPSGKKVLKENISLGEILCASEEKSWKLTF